MATGRDFHLQKLSACVSVLQQPLSALSCTPLLNVLRCLSSCLRCKSLSGSKSFQSYRNTVVAIPDHTVRRAALALAYQTNCSAQPVLNLGFASLSVCA